MKSVGEVMAIGRTFKEALQKGIRSLEIGRFGLGCDGKDLPDCAPDELRAAAARPNSPASFLPAARPSGPGWAWMKSTS